jgi:hypothetical protein
MLITSGHPKEFKGWLFFIPDLPNTGKRSPYKSGKESLPSWQSVVNNSQYTFQFGGVFLLHSAKIKLPEETRISLLHKVTTLG